MDENILKQAVFVFLHGPKAYPDESWKMILLNVLHIVGFEADELVYDEKLHLTNVVRASGLCGEGTVNEDIVIGSRLDSYPVRFGVIVKAGDGWNNEHAIRWLHEIAFQISGLRIGYVLREQLAKDEVMAQIRKRADILNGGVAEAFSVEKDAISHDPKTLESFELIADGTSDEFSGFFGEAFAQLVDVIDRSKALEPIVLSETGVTFIQKHPAGPHGKNLNDDMTLRNGIHRECGGEFSFHRISETYQVVSCDRCHWFKELPLSTARTFSQLRFLSPRPVRSDE